jgi:ABC-2 type transport system permease protein
MTTVVRKELRDQRRGLLGWGGGLALMVLMYASFWPSVRDNAGQFESYLENLPEAMRNIIGELSLGTPVGYLQSELFSFLGPALILVYAIGAGARSIAGEEELATMDLLAAAPVSRRRIVVEKFVAMSATAVGIGVILWVALVTIGPAFGLDVSAWNVAAATLQLVLLGIAFGAVALLLGAWLGRKSLAIAVTSALAVATFLLDAFAPAVEGLAWAEKVTPFHYYGDGPPLRDGLQVVNALVLVGLAAAGLLVSILTFDRRDIHA